MSSHPDRPEPEPGSDFPDSLERELQKLRPSSPRSGFLSELQEDIHRLGDMVERDAAPESARPRHPARRALVLAAAACAVSLAYLHFQHGAAFFPENDSGTDLAAASLESSPESSEPAVTSPSDETGVSPAAPPWRGKLRPSPRLRPASPLAREPSRRAQTGIASANHAALAGAEGRLPASSASAPGSPVPAHPVPRNFEPVSAQGYLIDASSGGIRHTEAGPREEMNFDYRDAYHWHDPGTGTNLRYFAPRRETVLIPLTTD